MDKNVAAQGMAAVLDTLDILDTFEKSRQIRKSSLTEKDRIFLHLLVLIGKMDESEIAKTFSIASSSVSDQVRRLEASRLVEKISDPEDGRRNFIEITPEGKSQLEKAQLGKGSLLLYSLLNTSNEGEIMLFISRMADGQDLLGKVLKQMIESEGIEEL